MPRNIQQRNDLTKMNLHKIKSSKNNVKIKKDWIDQVIEDEKKNKKAMYREMKKNLSIITNSYRKGKFRENFSEFIDFILSFNTYYFYQKFGKPSNLKYFIYDRIKYFNEKLKEIPFVRKVNEGEPSSAVLRVDLAGGIYGGTSWNHHFKEQTDDINKKAVLPGNYDIFFSLNARTNDDEFYGILDFFHSDFVIPIYQYFNLLITDYFTSQGVPEAFYKTHFKIFIEKVEKKVVLNDEGKKIDLYNSYNGTWSGGYGEKSSTKSYGFKIIFGATGTNIPNTRNLAEKQIVKQFKESIFNEAEPDDDAEPDNAIKYKKLLFYLEIQRNTINNVTLAHYLFQDDSEQKYYGLNIRGLNLVSNFLLDKNMRSKKKGFNLDIVRNNMLDEYYNVNSGDPRITKQIDALDMLFNGLWDEIFSDNKYSKFIPGVKDDWNNLRCDIFKTILEDEKTGAYITIGDAPSNSDHGKFLKIMGIGSETNISYSDFFKVLNDKVLNDTPGGGNFNRTLPSFRQLIDFVISGTNFQGQVNHGIFRLEGSGGDAIRHYLSNQIKTTADFDTKLFYDETILVANQIDVDQYNRAKRSFMRPSINVTDELGIRFNPYFYTNYSGNSGGSIKMRYFLEERMTILVAIISKILDEFRFFRFAITYKITIPGFEHHTFGCELNSLNQEKITRTRKINNYFVATPDFKSLLSLDARLKLNYFKYSSSGKSTIGYSFFDFAPLDIAFYDGRKKMESFSKNYNGIRGIRMIDTEGYRTSLFPVKKDGIEYGLLTPLPSATEIFEDLDKNLRGERAIERASVGKTRKDTLRMDQFKKKYEGPLNFYLAGDTTKTLDQIGNINDKPAFITIQDIFRNLIPKIFDPTMNTEDLTHYYGEISRGDYLTIVNAQLLLLMARSKGRKSLPYSNEGRKNFWKIVSLHHDVKESIEKNILYFGGRKKTKRKTKRNIKKSKRNKRNIKKSKKNKRKVRKNIFFRKSRRKIIKNKQKKKKNTQNSKK
jgi:hypothetical protein